MVKATPWAASALPPPARRRPPTASSSTAANTTINLSGLIESVGRYGVGDNRGLNLSGANARVNITGGRILTNTCHTNPAITFHSNPTGPSAQAASVGALTNTVNTIVNRRLSSGGLPGGNRIRSGLQPIQVAAEVLQPGLLAGGESTLTWGEFFGARRERGTEGASLAHEQKYTGFLFGGDQGNEFGVRGGVEGRHSFSDALSVVLDLEYRHNAGGLRERGLGGFARLEYAF